MSDQPIDKEKLKEYIAEELENVASLKKQLTDRQIDKLEEQFTKSEIHQTLLEMENHAPLKKKYRSVYLTLKNWIQLKRDKVNAQQTNSAKRMGFSGRMTYNEALSWLERKGIPFSSFENKFKREHDDNGKTYFVFKES